jgi:BirA family biotin operon repressor/biotin-[acetyl-CoA-carboxylase] ligase
VHLRRTGSTNERARELAFAGAPNGTLVTASEQTAGRGRQGRRWSAPAGSSILMSLLLRSPPPLLPLIAAVAVCDVAGASSPRGEQARIKWPNDVVLDAAGAAVGLAKLAGILVEGRPQEGWAVLGIGLNVAVRIEDLPAELRPDAPEHPPSGSPLPAATLGLAATQIEPTLGRLIDALARRLAEPDESTLEAWRAIEWSGGRGRADGIDGTGRLMVVLADGGRTALGAGEVHLRQIS